MASAMNSYDALLSASDAVAGKDGSRKKKAKAKQQGGSVVTHAQETAKAQVRSISTNVSVGINACMCRSLGEYESANQ